MDVANLAELLRETAEAHHPYEQSGPKHEWSDWYAAYLNARLEGSGPDEAAAAAAAHVSSLT
jgi:hypothetical protein